MYSIQRRNEWCKIIYIYKIKENLVPNISNKYLLTFKIHGRHGCKCEIPTFPIRGRASKARDSSFAWAACNVICRIRSLNVSGILSEKILCILRKTKIRSWPSARIYLDVVGLATHMTEMIASKILYATITEM